MQTATIYWDKYNGLHHTLVCEVSEENGKHVVVQSTVHDNVGQTIDKVASFWKKELGEANVRAYTITEYVQDVGRYSQV